MTMQWAYSNTWRSWIPLGSRIVNGFGGVFCCVLSLYQIRLSSISLFFFYHPDHTKINKNQQTSTNINKHQQTSTKNIPKSTNINKNKQKSFCFLLSHPKRSNYVVRPSVSVSSCWETTMRSSWSPSKVMPLGEDHNVQRSTILGKQTWRMFENQEFM